MDKYDQQLEKEIAAAIKEERQRIARAGGVARSKALSKEKRRRIALKAAAAAGKVHRAKAKARKKKDKEA
jgi:hypothetical protein